MPEPTPVTDASSANPPDRLPRDPAVRVIAFLEAAKGGLILLAGSGLLSLMHRDLHALALKLIAHSHLNPAAHYPQIFVDAAGRLGDTRLLTLAIGAFAYALIRFVEAYGLFFERAWAEVLAAISGAIYVPFELHGLARHPTWLGLILLALNLLTVAIMVHAMLRRRVRMAEYLSSDTIVDSPQNSSPL